MSFALILAPKSNLYLDLTGEKAATTEIFSIATPAVFDASEPTFPKQMESGKYEPPAATDSTVQIFNISQVGTHGLFCRIKDTFGIFY